MHTIMYPSSLAFKEDFTSKATPLVPPMAQLSVKSVEPCRAGGRLTIILYFYRISYCIPTSAAINEV